MSYELNYQKEETVNVLTCEFKIPFPQTYSLCSYTTSSHPQVLLNLTLKCICQIKHQAYTCWWVNPVKPINFDWERRVLKGKGHCQEKCSQN
jgi:hypothetical protein